MNTHMNTSHQEIPLACTLTEAEQVTRQSQIDDLFAHAEQIRELTDGYAFQYPGTTTWASTLTDFIVQERACCLFFHFDLVFEPNLGPIWLHVRGGDGVKDLLHEQLLTHRSPTPMKKKHEEE
jgi:hypothetical protein